ncbi:DUF1302 domain-containing protein [Bacterioplanoides sp. SCSIO 12839]|uniref:DUF1302 domain-containing protein n=1 Tax=Bacterioplanoides sp. SCSIO 12839 TaxID=2829569 RepID=UPI002102FB65|nr:DUF1302 domain-containing protein [Bacterioplanoides sp. SCSIO 12839]UTW49145.1 DUF1302 domain-containing protein [Bacterioplanoides sp. SCSIO 12839]
MKKITKKGLRSMKKLPLALAVSALSVSTAQAVEFNFGDITAQWDNTVSYGVGWRVEDRDEGQIMAGNGAAVGETTSGSSYNYDDGTLNYDKGDIYTNVVKWSSDLEISYQNYGGFFRARAYYDTAIMDEDPEFKAYNDDTKERAGADVELLDAYLWADYYIGDTPVSFRVGRQVVSWGESTFIQGGINSINPVDASAFRKPGAEVKEGLLPVNMLYTSIGLTADVTLEAFYQLEWEKTRIDPCGTFFSTVDFVADGCGPVVLGGTEAEQVYIALREQEIADGTPRSQQTSPITDRLSDDEPKDSGQYGLALRWYSEALGDTEFGFYHMNIHSRLPYINGAVTNYDTLGLVTGTRGGQVNQDATYDTFRPLYQIAYPEDLQISGVSFATSTEGGASISGEISYKPDSPVQWNAFEVLLAGNGAPWSRLYQQRAAEVGGNEASLFGEVAQGYDELDIWQAQMTFIKFYDQVLGADRISLVSEIGMTYVDDLPDSDDARYGRSGAYGIGNNEGVFFFEDGLLGSVFPADKDYCTADEIVSDTPNTTKNANTSYCNDEGYVNELSGGIRVRATMDFNNAFAGINVSPRVSLAYDQGNGPEPGSQFIDDRLTTALSVSFVYQNRTSVDIGYTNFSGGDYNVLKDRDNVTLSAKYSF